VHTDLHRFHRSHLPLPRRKLNTGRHLLKMARHRPPVRRSAPICTVHCGGDDDFEFHDAKELVHREAFFPPFSSWRVDFGPPPLL
jgi:hypothetical protein